MNTELTTRKLGIGTLLSMSFEIYKKYWKVILSLYFITLFFADLVGVLLDTFSPFEMSTPVQQSLFDFAVFLFVLSFAFFFNIGLMELVKTELTNKEVTVNILIAGIKKYWIKVMATGLWTVLFLLGLFLLLIIPGVIFGVYWYFSLMVVVFKEKSGKAALSESKSIVTGRWWSVVLYLLVFGVISLLFHGILKMIFSFFPDFLLFDFLYLPFSGMIAAYFFIVSVLYFVNLDSNRISK